MDTHMWDMSNHLRQFWSEAFLLRHFARHRCRVAHSPRHGMQTTPPTPHFFVVPVLWRCISLVPDKWLRAKLLTRATKLVNQIVLAPDSPVHTAPEAHVLFHTSTAAVGTVYGAELAKRFADPRYVHLVFEGAGGDPRQRSEWRQSRYLAPGQRSIVVPYFVEPRDTLSHWLAQWCPSACASTKQSIQRAGSGGVVYFALLLEWAPPSAPRWSFRGDPWRRCCSHRIGSQ